MNAYICKKCGGPSPVGVGYIAENPTIEEIEASARVPRCACGYSRRPPAERVILIGCVAGKLAVPARARDLYTGDLFRARLEYAEASGQVWGVLSALYGAISPYRVIRPYDMTIRKRLTKTGGALGWAIDVIQGCYRLAGHHTTLIHDVPDGRRVFARPLTIEIHAGVDYVRTIEELAVPQFGDAAKVTIEHPVAGLGIGAQKHFYKTHSEARG